MFFTSSDSHLSTSVIEGVELISTNTQTCTTKFTKINLEAKTNTSALHPHNRMHTLTHIPHTNTCIFILTSVCYSIDPQNFMDQQYNVSASIKRSLTVVSAY